MAMRLHLDGAQVRSEADFHEAARLAAGLVLDVRVSDDTVVAARRDAIRRMADAGMSASGIARAVRRSHGSVLAVIGTSAGGADAGSRCSQCGEVKPLDRYSLHRRKADGCQSYCLPCGADIDRRAKLVAYRRRRNGEGGVPMSVRINRQLRDVLDDTAQRHRVTKTAIVERALTRALACKDCGRRLRQVGSDCCSQCDSMWTPSAVAS